MLKSKLSAAAMRKEVAAFNKKYEGVDPDLKAILNDIGHVAARGQTRLHWTMLPEEKRFSICNALRELGYDVKRGMLTGATTLALDVDWSGNGI